MSQLLPSRDDESAMWHRIESQRRMRQAASAQVTPQGYQNLIGMQQAYPQVATGTKVSLAQAGVSPTDPIMANVVAADQSVKRKRGFGFHTIGDVVSAGLHNTIGRGLAAAGDVLAPVGDAAGRIVRPGIRTGLMTLAATVVLYCVVRYTESASLRWLITASAVMGVSVLAKETGA